MVQGKVRAFQGMQTEFVLQAPACGSGNPKPDSPP